MSVLNHSLDKMSSVWARPTHSINFRVNGAEAPPLDKMPSVWPAHSLNNLSTKWAGYLVNGIHAHSLDGLLIEWGTHPLAYQFIN